MKLSTGRAVLKIPMKLVFTTIGCAIACGGTPAAPGPDASADVAIADASPDGCVYQLCTGSDASACPGIVCLPPTESCPSGCEPVV